ncbi:PA-phosphatase [Mycobacterium sp. smrl_JER01]|uniref:PA-phosphatase n=1 Tax=Mycobacterium sp. smrl_JER01 TaxID=3402633 RepID=UPI003AC0FF18
MFTDGTVVMVLCAVVFIGALVQRRWRLAAATVVTPGLAVVAARVGKRMFGRVKDDATGGSALCYPSGHTTVTFVVLAMAVLLLGVTTWAVAVAATAMVLGVLGQAVSYHFFTDAIGAVLLASALVCLTVTLARLDGRQT